MGDSETRVASGLEMMAGVCVGATCGGRSPSRLRVNKRAAATKKILVGRVLEVRGLGFRGTNSDSQARKAMKFTRTAAVVLALGAVSLLAPVVARASRR